MQNWCDIYDWKLCCYQKAIVHCMIPFANEIWLSNNTELEWKKLIISVNWSMFADGLHHRIESFNHQAHNMVQFLYIWRIIFFSDFLSFVWRFFFSLHILICCCFFSALLWWQPEKKLFINLLNNRRKRAYLRKKEFRERCKWDYERENEN